MHLLHRYHRIARLVAHLDHVTTGSAAQFTHFLHVRQRGLVDLVVDLQHAAFLHDRLEAHLRLGPPGAARWYPNVQVWSSSSGTESAAATALRAIKVEGRRSWRCPPGTLQWRARDKHRRLLRQLLLLLLLGRRLSWQQFGLNLVDAVPYRTGARHFNAASPLLKPSQSLQPFRGDWFHCNFPSLVFFVFDTRP